MITNKVYRLTKNVEVGRNMPLQAGQEIEVVMDAVYINGNPLQPELQPLFLKFVMENQSILEDVTKKWK
jgi:hypothetical protein